MEKQTSSVREIGQLMSVAIVAVLFGSTMILSAVGPARASEETPRASEAPALASHDMPAPSRYLA
jgi:chorismate mutase